MRLLLFCFCCCCFCLMLSKLENFGINCNAIQIIAKNRERTNGKGWAIYAPRGALRSLFLSISIRWQLISQRSYVARDLES